MYQTNRLLTYAMADYSFGFTEYISSEQNARFPLLRNDKLHDCFPRIFKYNFLLLLFDVASTKFCIPSVPYRLICRLKIWDLQNLGCALIRDSFLDLQFVGKKEWNLPRAQLLSIGDATLKNLKVLAIFVFFKIFKFHDISLAGKATVIFQVFQVLWELW